jgi:hypothetical protein
MNATEARAKLATMLDNDLVIEWLLSADERSAIEWLLAHYWDGYRQGRSEALAEVQALLDARAA